MLAQGVRTPWGAGAFQLVDRSSDERGALIGGQRAEATPLGAAGADREDERTKREHEGDQREPVSFASRGGHLVVQHDPQALLDPSAHAIWKSILHASATKHRAIPAGARVPAAGRRGPADGRPDRPQLGRIANCTSGATPALRNAIRAAQEHDEPPSDDAGTQRAAQLLREPCMDLLFVLSTLAFFAVSVVYVRGCDSL